ncbi:MAG: alanine racemase [Candidatus Eisenbacteria bacterium]|nr:alanine racemase [Candidatus Eisenbacteria bacterium]
MRALKAFLGQDRHLWAVVKANAYGHGAPETASAALAAGADGLAVSCLSEAAEVRMDARIKAPLLVLAPGEPRAALWMVRLDIIQTACYEAMATALSEAAVRLEKPARVHLKIDTGMGRLGVPPERAAEFALSVTALPGVCLEGVFSHLATAEAEDASFTRLQFERFEEALTGLEAAGVSCGMRHLANSAATLRFPEMLLDGVRAGLLIYGITPDATDLAAVDLRPAMSWKTRVSFLHRLPPGSPVSYGCTYRTNGDCLVGVLPLGYADGYPRSASNRGYVLLRGRRCPIIGVVCMDHMMVDATGVPEAAVDDEVLLLGQQGNETITANQLAQWAGTVVHEVPTVIGRRVKRVYLEREQS